MRLSARWDRAGCYLQLVVGRKKLCLLGLGYPISSNPMLTGTDLLSKVKDLGDASKTDLARGCGYVSTKKDGSERVNFTAFYEALLEAKGVSLSNGGGSAIGNGNLLIGKAYTALLDLESGDEFEIKLGKKQIRLVPVGGSDEEE